MNKPKFYILSLIFLDPLVGGERVSGSCLTCLGHVLVQFFQLIPTFWQHLLS